jgi:mono/diheme cytochrome c family protein
MRTLRLTTIGRLTAALVITLAMSRIGSVQAANPSKDQLAHGHEVFEAWCAPCHAPVSGQERLAGTSTLQMIYKGAKPAALEQRTDLTPERVAYYVRHGDNAMPWFRKTELSDEDLAAVGAYLARNNPKK